MIEDPSNIGIPGHPKCSFFVTDPSTIAKNAKGIAHHESMESNRCSAGIPTLAQDGIASNE
jgi:hypothetical protein